MRKIILASIIILIITSCQDVTSLASSIAKENIVECEFVGLGGSKSSVYKKFKKIKRNASKEELLKLLDHDSIAVVVYSSYALIERELITPNRLFAQFLNRNEKVSTFCGCILGEESISSLIYYRYWNSRVEYPDENDYEKQIINDSKELKKMDSLILYTKKPVSYLLMTALENRIYSNEYKSKIEELAFKKSNFYALEYIFKNFLIGNEDKLEFSLKEYLKNEDVYNYQKESINQMLSVIKNRA